MKTFMYQNLKNKDYFEGWYFRFTDSKTTVNYAVIFALTKSSSDPHSFIQVFNEHLDECFYTRFDVTAFKEEDNKLYIEQNYISLDEININTPDFNLNMKFSQLVSLNGKSAMGYLKNSPLDCYQEVIYLDGIATGSLNSNPVTGKMYIEKTYGNKFPVRWIWLQSNHSQKKSNISFSIGYIPVLFFKVKGYLAILKTSDGLFKFHSLAGSFLTIKKNTLMIRNWNKKLVITYQQDKTIKLVGPSKKAKMDLDVFESLTSTATVKLYINHKLVFEDKYSNVGLEVMM